MKNTNRIKRSLLANQADCRQNIYHQSHAFAWWNRNVTYCERELWWTQFWKGI